MYKIDFMLIMVINRQKSLMPKVAPGFSKNIMKNQVKNYLLAFFSLRFAMA